MNKPVRLLEAKLMGCLRERNLIFSQEINTKVKVEKSKRIQVKDKQLLDTPEGPAGRLDYIKSR